MPHQDAAPHETKPRQGGHHVTLNNLFRLDDRTVVVTGGGGGLGTVAADAILTYGGDVVCLDIQKEPDPGCWANLEATAKECDGRIWYFTCDATTVDSVSQVFATFLPLLRHPLRGLVACVGRSDDGPATEYPPASFLRLLEVNVMSTYIVAQATAREMKAKNATGSMALIASMSGWVVNKGANSAGYNTAKSGVIQLGRSLAAEWGSSVNMPLIRVNTLSPGYIKTAATIESLKIAGMEERWSEQNMLNRMSYPDEFRGPIIFLLSDASSYMTAADLRVDGGHCAW